MFTGARADQTDTRAAFNSTMPGLHNTERYHPVLHWTQADIDAYRAEHNLPEHPLDALGYRSIGCAPCTTIPLESDGQSRGGRWATSEKTECGLHLQTS